ncbi:hypothetical protein QJS04_geneDACA020564 [Acorus gramineus]|uniref:Uncharacterized protein n=1 Tax=Acorus gramineus TaxID=55184 RepID=A0AAV8ZZI8_ACOGR|nr:hypothetical protein QJS04_geneDACA020564 [Acorus gramineus]
MLCLQIRQPLLHAPHSLRQSSSSHRRLALIPTVTGSNSGLEIFPVRHRCPHRSAPTQPLDTQRFTGNSLPNLLFNSQNTKEMPQGLVCPEGSHLHPYIDCLSLQLQKLSPRRSSLASNYPCSQSWVSYGGYITNTLCPQLRQLHNRPHLAHFACIVCHVAPRVAHDPASRVRDSACSRSRAKWSGQCG